MYMSNSIKNNIEAIYIIGYIKFYCGGSLLKYFYTRLAPLCSYVFILRIYKIAMHM